MRSRYVSVLASCLVLLAACSDETEPEVHAVVWGFVTTPDGPVAATVTAKSSNVTVDAVTNSSGRYDLPLPAGRYQISLRVRDVFVAWLLDNGEFGGRGSLGSRGELDIGTGATPTRIDASLSTVDGTIAGLEALEGETILVRFAESVSHASVDQGQARFHFPAVATGRYTLRVGDVFLPGVYRDNDAEETLVLPGERVSIETTLAPPAIVRGRVVDPFGVASEAVQYRVERWFTHELDTGADGTFEIPVWSDSVSFFVGSFGFSPELDGEERSFPVKRGQTIDLPPLVVPGILVDAVGLDGYRIQYFAERADSPVRLRFDDSTLGPLAAGRYYVYAAHGLECQPSWIPSWYDGAQNRDDATIIEISPQSPTHRISFMLPLGGRISGRILGVVSGYPVTVTLVGDDDVEICPVLLDAEDGFYRFSGLPTGSYRLAVKQLDTVYWYPGVVSEDDATTVQVQAGQVVEHLDMNWPGFGAP